MKITLFILAIDGKEVGTSGSVHHTRSSLFAELRDAIASDADEEWADEYNLALSTGDWDRCDEMLSIHKDPLTTFDWQEVTLETEKALLEQKEEVRRISTDGVGFSDQELEDYVINTLCKNQDLPREEVCVICRLEEDLHLTDLDRIELSFDLDGLFVIELPDRVCEGWKNVQDIIDSIKKELTEKHGNERDRA